MGGGHFGILHVETVPERVCEVEFADPLRIAVGHQVHGRRLDEGVRRDVVTPLSMGMENGTLSGIEE